MEIVSKRPLRYPITIEREYAKFLLALSAEVRKFLKSRAKDIVDTLEGRGDDINPSVIYVIFDRLSRQMDKIVAAKVITPRLERIYKAIGNYTENELQQQYKSVFGQQMSLKFNAENSGINLNTLKGVWIDENLDLIKSIPAKALDDLKPFLRDRVLNSVNGANLVKDLTAEVERLAGVQKNRAALIATDQVGKVHGAMMRNRQTTAGIKKFKWRSSQDQRVRPRHRELNGKVFEWDNPPSEGTPGTPIRCRCVALPVFDIREALGVAQPIPGTFDPAIQGKVKLGINLFPPKDPLYIDSFSIEEEDGFKDVYLHGNEKKVEYNGKQIGAKEFATVLRENGYKGGDIRLVSCATGKGENSIAQELSKELGIIVKAPDDDVWYAPDEGTVFVGDSRRNTGRWRVFDNGVEVDD